MSQKPFLPRSETDRRPWLNNFVDKLQDPAEGYAAKYNISGPTLSALDNGRQWVNWVMDNLDNPRQSAQSLTAFKNLLFTGTQAALIVPVQTPFSAVPAAGAPPVTIPPVGGVFTLAGSVGSQIKRAVDYDPADGEDLGLEGPEQPLPDPASTAPGLSLRLASGGHVEVVWRKDPFDALKIEVDRGTGAGFAFLAVDTEPNYIDTVTPAPGATAIYTYRAIYLLADAEYGQWSQPAEITVRG